MAITKTILFLLIFVVGGIALQIFLSKRPGKWPGLILPAICLLISLVAVLGNIAFQTRGELTMQQIAPDGTVIEERVGNQQARTAEVGVIVVQMAIIFVLYNIPTVVLLGIYAACRGTGKKNTPIEKMNIQDLE